MDDFGPAPAPDMGMGEMPPMQDTSMGGMEDPSMGMPQMDPTGMGGVPTMGQNPFDSNFDAGVEADEQSDPKHFIQQLTGKLSQSLRSYNSNLPQPDADLAKYVAGMILKQTTEGLTDEDKNEVLNKINGNGDEDKMPDQTMGEAVERLDNLNDTENDETDAKRDRIPSNKRGSGPKYDAFTPKTFS